MRDRLLIGVFLAMLSLPLVCFKAGIAVRPTDFDADRLHARPSLTSARGIPRFVGGWLDYFGDHFGLRAALIRAHAVVSAKVSMRPVADGDSWA